MTRIRDAGKVRARERIAALAALNLAFEVADRDAAAAQAAAQPAPAAAPISAVAPTEQEYIAPAELAESAGSGPRTGRTVAVNPAQLSRIMRHVPSQGDAPFD